MRRPSQATRRALALSLVAIAACNESGREAPDVETPDADVIADAVADDASDDHDVADTTADTVGPELPGEYLSAEPQRDGDPAKGFATLAGGDYVGCGMPATLYPLANRAGIFGDEPKLPGRDGELPYYLSQFQTASGVEVVGPNCFTCHAGTVPGVDGIVLGAPGIDLDFGGFAAQITRFGDQVSLLQDVLKPDAYAELVRFADRLTVVAPWVQADESGTNPADNLAGILFAHRDRTTLAWSEEPLLDPPPQVVVPVDVPPLWRMKKKHAMFYSAAGRGDHARIMMTTSTLCVDSRAEASSIDARFPDVRAWILSLVAPPWPEDTLGAIDRTLAGKGKAVFVATCAKCHGTYADDPTDDAHDTYPNLWVKVDDVATDSALALGAAHVVTRFVDWFNQSFYGELGHLDPKPGYVPPPLDGIWATAPYLHNASVPTLAAMIDSRLRPKYWRRAGAWDAVHVGLGFVASDVGQAGLTGNAKHATYDTTLLGHSNRGHLYGDVLTDEQRAALLEYLKTL